MRVSVGQHSSAGGKERNDDFYGVVVPKRPLLVTKGIAAAIADGASVSEGADVASETCVRSFLEDYYGTHEAWAVKTSVGRVLTAVNRWLHAQSLARYDSERALATTFSAAVLKGGSAYLFHAGDSRIALLREGRLEALTENHRVRLGRDREHLSRAVGLLPDLAVDHREIPLENGDILVFTTDGVHDHLDEVEMARLIAVRAEDLHAAAAAIVDAARAAGSPDNLTCQILRIEDAGRLDPFALTERLQSLPFPPDLEPGMLFEGFRILRELHAGPRSQVHLARDEATGREAVIKTPSRNFEGDPDYVRQFIREEWVGLLIDNPHVVRFRAPERTRRFLYVLSDLVNGETLAARLERGPRPSLSEVRDVVEQLAKGLRAFHRHDIVHQDLKPDNILVDERGRLTIIDLGSVRIAGLEELRRSAEARLLGTREYIAPEYLDGGTPTPRSDLYSLGVLAYRMLSNGLPYGEGFASVADVARAEYVPLTSRNPDVPPWVDHAVRRAVSIDPSRRQETPEAFVVDLAKPSDAYADQRRQGALLQRNPRLFLKLALVASLVANLALLIVLARR